MLKQVLYYLMLVTTTVRFVDMIYLLAKDNTNLPVPVLIVTTFMVLYGIYLVVRKFLGNILLKQLMTFYVIQTVMIVFNLVYFSIASPLQVSILETVAIGTFLDIIVNASVIYLCTKQMRSHYFAVTQPVAATSNRHV